jgi:hypothetical protein
MRLRVACFVEDFVLIYITTASKKIEIAENWDSFSHTDTS